MIARRARKVDANQAQIISGMRAIGASVMIVNGDVDLICGFRGVNYLLEVKASRKSQLKASQIKLLDEWRGQYAIITTLEEALAVIGIQTMKTRLEHEAYGTGDPHEGIG